MVCMYVLEHAVNRVYVWLLFFQEVDVYTFDMTDVLGSLVVDVKGYLLLTACKDD